MGVAHSYSYKLLVPHMLCIMLELRMRMMTRVALCEWAEEGLRFNRT